jgi:hypothetical protein
MLDTGLCRIFFGLYILNGLFEGFIDKTNDVKRKRASVVENAFS